MLITFNKLHANSENEFKNMFTGMNNSTSDKTQFKYLQATMAATQKGRYSHAIQKDDMMIASVEPDMAAQDYETIDITNAAQYNIQVPRMDDSKLSAASITIQSKYGKYQTTMPDLVADTANCIEQLLPGNATQLQKGIAGVDATISIARDHIASVNMKHGSTSNVTTNSSTRTVATEPTNTYTKFHNNINVTNIEMYYVLADDRFNMSNLTSEHIQAIRFTKENVQPDTMPSLKHSSKLGKICAIESIADKAAVDLIRNPNTNRFFAINHPSLDPEMAVRPANVHTCITDICHRIGVKKFQSLLKEVTTQVTGDKYIMIKIDLKEQKPADMPNMYLVLYFNPTQFDEVKPMTANAISSISNLLNNDPLSNIKVTCDYKDISADTLSQLNDMVKYILLNHRAYSELAKHLYVQIMQQTVEPWPSMQQMLQIMNMKMDSKMNADDIADINSLDDLKDMGDDEETADESESETNTRKDDYNNNSATIKDKTHFLDSDNKELAINIVTSENNTSTDTKGKNNNLVTKRGSPQYKEDLMEKKGNTTVKITTQETAKERMARIKAEKQAKNKDKNTTAA